MARSPTFAAAAASKGLGPVVAAVLLAACGGSPPSTPAASAASQATTASPSTSANRISVTLSDTDCTLDGESELSAGPVEIKMHNATDGQFDLDIWRLDDGHSFDELAEHIDEEMRRISSGEPPLGHPPFAELVAESTAETGMDGELDAELMIGTYGFACIYFPSAGELGAIRSAGPREVS